jgi:hypothetical protein
MGMWVARCLLGAPGDDEGGVGLGREHAHSHHVAGLAARAPQAVALHACSATDPPQHHGDVKGFDGDSTGCGRC